MSNVRRSASLWMRSPRLTSIRRHYFNTMKKNFIAITGIAAIFSLMFAVDGMAQSHNNSQNSKMMNTNKILVAYFSCTGNTKAAAEKIAKAQNADLYEIKPEQAYTANDLDWRNKQSRSYVEMLKQYSTFRPKIATSVENFSQYETVYVGYPIWWNLAPTIINTFLESYDFTGKNVILFATSGGSPIDNSVKVLKKTYSHISFNSLKNTNTD